MNLREHLLSRQRELLTYLESVTSAIDHHGEAGRDLELRVRDLLTQFLPGRFGLSSGFVRSLDDPDWQSNQIDLLITRKDIGYPLAVFPGNEIYPIEAVVGFVEVTRTLNAAKLEEDFEKVRDLKRRTSRTYVYPYSYAKAAGIVPRTASEPADSLKKVVLTTKDLEPRFYYFAFTTDWKKPESLCKVLQGTGNKLGVHCHGVFIPDFGFFMHQAVASGPSNHDVKYVLDPADAFITFLSVFLESLQTFTDPSPVASIPFDQYGLSPGEFFEYNGRS